MNGSVVSVLISDIGMSGTEHSIHGVPWRAWCGNLTVSMESQGERSVDMLMGYQEKSEL